MAQKRHAQQHLVYLQPRADGGGYRTQLDATDTHPLQVNGIADGDTVGRLRPNRPPRLQVECARHVLGDGNAGGAGVEQEGNRHAVDRTAGDVVAETIALQYHLTRSIRGDLRFQVLVGVELTLQMAAEERHAKPEKGQPGKYLHDEAHAFVFVCFGGLAHFQPVRSFTELLYTLTSALGRGKRNPLTPGGACWGTEHGT